VRYTYVHSSCDKSQNGTLERLYFMIEQRQRRDNVKMRKAAIVGTDGLFLGDSGIHRSHTLPTVFHEGCKHR